MADIWLLVSCVFLCFVAGDAVICRQCSSMRPWIPCLPLHSRCAALRNRMVCITLKIFRGFQPWQKILTCTTVDDGKCDNSQFDVRSGKLYSYACCSDKNYCTGP